MTQAQALQIAPSFDLAVDKGFAELREAVNASTPEWPEALDRFMAKGAAYAYEIMERVYNASEEGRKVVSDALTFLSQHPTEGLRFRNAITEWGPLRVRPEVHQLADMLEQQPKALLQGPIMTPLDEVQLLEPVAVRT